MIGEFEMRIIDSDALMRKIDDTYDLNYGEILIDPREFYSMVDDAPTVDAVAVRGKWIITEYDYFDCSVCGEAYYNSCESTEQAKRYLAKGYAYNYCPHCGAKNLTGGDCDGKAIDK